MRQTAFVTIILFGLMAVWAQQPPANPGAQSSPQPAQGQQPRQPSDEEVMAQAAKTAQATTNWDKASSPGMKAEVSLLKKTDLDGRSMAEYHVKVTGAPHNQPYTLMGWPVTVPDAFTMMDGLAVAQDGTVGCPPDSTASCAQKFKGAELRLIYQATKGEIFRHALISADQKSRIFFSIVPDPILASDKACSLEAVRLSPGFELVLVRGRGFPAGEDIRFHEQSYQEVHDLPVKTDAQGEFQAWLTPTVKGRIAGTADITVTGKTCAPTISFNWGLQP
jgi:hypothetical protein